MGKPGPKKTPTATLKARDSWRGKVRKDEPTGEPGRPARPSWLRPDAKIIWNRVVPLIESMRILTKADEQPLVRYCQTFAKWRALEEFIAENGETYSVEINGNIKCLQRPESAIAAKHVETLGRIEATFGLSPSARASLAIVPERKPEPNGKERFFKGTGT